LRINPYSKLSIMPNYPINRAYENKDLLATSEDLPESLYMYYFKLFYLARVESFDEKTFDRILADPSYRADHHRLNPFLPMERENIDHQNPVAAAKAC